MKNELKKAFALFLTVVVLLTNTGFGLVEHSCAMRGKNTTIGFKKQTCCPVHKKQHISSKETSFNKKQCCTDEEKYGNVEYSSSISQLVAKFLNTVVEYAVGAVKFVFQLVLEAVASLISSLLDSSSSHVLSGRDMLSLTQSYLI
jgi:hypothetical protein